MKFLSKGAPEARHRLIILTDMENEPDDSQTMVKLLMYANELDIEGLITVTSRWLPDRMYPESIAVRVQAYGVVRPYLQKHATGWPTEAYLTERIASGQWGYGMQGVGDGKSTSGSDLIIKAVDADDPRPVWVAINAGSNTLAQALWDVKRTRTAEEIDRFVRKLRVYDDSGQDDAGAWMCHTFPELFFIRSRVQVFGLYGPQGGGGPEPWLPLDQFAWAERNIRTRHGILGALYPQRIFPDGRHEFMEGGGTSTWIGLVNKALFVPDQISWGGWGGRFSWEKEQVPAGMAGVAELEDKFKPYAMYPQAMDDSFDWECPPTVKLDLGTGANNEIDTRIFAPLWRWRTAYVNDFKARMDWCVSEYEQANHHPVINFMGDENRSVIYLEAEAGETVTLDASASYDPDVCRRSWQRSIGETNEEQLQFNWFTYPEAGTYTGKVGVEKADASIASLTIPTDASGKQIHVVLEVTDRDPKAPLTSYRRIVIDVM